MTNIDGLVTIEANELENFQSRVGDLQWAIQKLSRDAYALGADADLSAVASERRRLWTLLREARATACDHIDRVRRSLVEKGQRSSYDVTTKGNRPWCEKRGGWWEM